MKKDGIMGAVRNGIEIRAGLEEPEEKGRPAAALLFLEAGVFGVLFLLGSMKGVFFSEWAVYPVTALLCWGIWFTYYGSRKAYLLLVLGAVAVYGVVVFGMEDTLGEQLRYLAGCVLGGSKEEPVDVTTAVLLLAAVFAFFTAMSEFLVRSHMLLYLLTTVLLLLTPLWGIRPGAEVVLLLAVFQAAFWVMQADGLAPWRLSFEGVLRRQIMGKSSFAVGGAVTILFVAVFPLVFLGADRLFDGIYDAESRIYQTISHLTGRDAVPAAGGRVGRGNQYRTGTPQLEVEVDIKPSEALYLSGFQGDEYTGGGWESLGEGGLFETLEEKLGWQMYSNGRFSAGNLYESMYFMMNMNQEEEPPACRNLKIRHMNGEYENLYVPYYSQRGWGWGGSFAEGYLFWYYEQQEMKIAWEEVREDFAVIRDWYRELREAYQEEIHIAYTRVPMQLLPRLTNLCSVNHCESLEEITAFILYTLHENAQYTMTPGWAPVNEDIVEYLLFESGRGYCEHFASAAALMYRLYGIPARYVSGYMVQPWAFVQQETGSWKAVVTDREAHAWVEIFLEDYGWTPVEVTPTAGGGSAARYPGFHHSIFRKLVAEKDWNWEKTELHSGMEGNSEAGWRMWEGLADLRKDFGEADKWLYAAAACGLYTLCLCPVLLDYRRMRRLKRLEMGSCRTVFFRLLEMLRFAGCMPGYDGTERDFALKLEETTGVSEKDIAWMQERVSQAAYGPPCRREERETGVWQVYLLVAEAVYRKLGWYKRFVFRYWKGFW